MVHFTFLAGEPIGPIVNDAWQLARKTGRAHTVHFNNGGAYMIAPCNTAQELCLLMDIMALNGHLHERAVGA